MGEASPDDFAVDRVIAIDWSGDRSAAGQRRKIWAGVWTRGAAPGTSPKQPKGDPSRRLSRTGVFGGTFRLETGRTRVELTDWLIRLAAETPRTVVGIDCCFSFPAWFLKEHGCASIQDFWHAVAAGKGEGWLHRDSTDGRFWGVVGPSRTGKRPLEFSGPGLRRMMRSTDWENKIAVRQEGGDAGRAELMRGITAKSPFQIGGSGSVGTGSLRAMPVLLALRGAGFRIWPFDAAALTSTAPTGAGTGSGPQPLVVEMYTRLLTGPVAKSNERARRDYLRARCSGDPAYAALGRAVLAQAHGSEDAFDALVCTLEMARQRGAFSRLLATSDPVLRLEGITWRPGV